MYINPVGIGLDSSDIRERVYSVLKNPAFLCINQLFRIETIKKIWPLFNHPYYVNIDTVISMFAALLGPYAISAKAYYYYYLRPFESNEDRRKRYMDNVGQNVPTINPTSYVPRIYWQLCQKYAAHIADDLLKTDINTSCCWMIINNPLLEDQEWIERQVAMSPTNFSVPGISRAYCAIAAAMRAEETCRFYRNHYKGQFSQFRPIAEDYAKYFYVRMWEILIKENYIVPQYKLNAEETEMFNKLMRYKNERFHLENRYAK